MPVSLASGFWLTQGFSSGRHACDSTLLDPIVLEHQPEWAEKQQVCRNPDCKKLCLSFCPGCAKAEDAGPASGFYCHGKGRDCLAARHRKLCRTKA